MTEAQRKKIIEMSAVAQQLDGINAQIANLEQNYWVIKYLELLQTKADLTTQMDDCGTIAIEECSHETYVYLDTEVGKYCGMDYREHHFRCLDCGHKKNVTLFINGNEEYDDSELKNFMSNKTIITLGEFEDFDQLRTSYLADIIGTSAISAMQKVKTSQPKFIISKND